MRGFLFFPDFPHHIIPLFRFFSVDCLSYPHKRMLDGLILGLMVSRAAAERTEIESFDAFLKAQSCHLQRLSKDHPVPIDERLGKASARYLFR